MSYCPDCGNELVLKELKNEGMVPYCTKCNEYKFPKFNAAVSMIVRYKDKIILIKQYGKDDYILVAGYINITESAEEAVYRELKEELNLIPTSIKINRTKYYEKSNTLLINFTVFVDDISNLSITDEVDSYDIFSIEDAIKENSLAKYFLLKYLEENYD